MGTKMQKPLTVLLFALSAASAHAAGTEQSYKGSWQGPIQFHVTENGKPDLASHAITSGKLQIDSGGVVTGEIPAGGCQLLGLAKLLSASVPALADLDLTFKGCKDPRFSIRYGGTLNGISGELTLRPMSSYASTRPSVTGLLKH